MNPLHILSGTPLWVWGILVYLIIMGIKASKPATVSISRLAILPAIFFCWSLYSLHAKYGFAASKTSLWSACLLAGMLAGWHLFKNLKVEPSGLIHTRGSWYPLVLSLIFFLIKYGINASYSINSETRSITLLWVTDLMVSGFVSGIFWGRLFQAWKLVANINGKTKRVK